jgi:hypothetical protein
MILWYITLFLKLTYSSIALFRSDGGSKTTCKPTANFVHQMAKDFLLDVIKKIYQIIYYEKGR